MKSKNMTYGNPFLLILSFSIPLMLGNIFQQFYILVDTFIVGNWVGVHALAAIGAVEWTIFLVLGGVQGITHGFSIPMAQSFGNHDLEELTAHIACSGRLSAIFSVFLLILGQILVAPLLELLHVPSPIHAIAGLYLRILYAGIPFTFFFHLSAAILRAIGNSRIPLIAMTLSSIMNIILDIIAVVFLKAGVGGAAFATVLSQLIAAAFCINYLRKSNLNIFKVRHNVPVDRKIYFQQLAVAIPMGLQNIITAIGGVFVTSIVNSFGVAFIAGYTAANKLYGLLEIPASSYGYTLSAYAGQNMGKKEIQRVNKGLTAGCALGILTAALMAFIMKCAGRNILTCFLPANAALSGDAVIAGMEFLKILSMFFGLLYILYILRGCIQGLGNSVIPMLSSLLQLCMRVFFVLYVCRIMGKSAVFWGEIAAWAGADALLLSYYLFYRKKWRDGTITMGIRL